MISVTIESGKALCLNCGRVRVTTVVLAFGSISVRICERCFAELVEKMNAVTY